MFELFDYYRSTASYRVRISLNFKDIPHKLTSVHLVNDGGEQHKPEYGSINPQNLVPTLKLEDGTYLTQSIAIIEYLDALHPEPRLIPEDLNLAAKSRAIANIICQDIHPINNLRVLQYLKNNLEISEDDKIKWYHNWVDKGFTAIEKILESLKCNGKFCIGNNVSLADVCLIPQVYNANRFKLSMDRFPIISSINEHCLDIDCFAKASPDYVTGN